MQHIMFAAISLNDMYNGKKILFAKYFRKFEIYYSVVVIVCFIKSLK